MELGIHHLRDNTAISLSGRRARRRWRSPARWPPTRA